MDENSPVNQPTGEQQPVQAENETIEQQMAAEMENSRLIEEQQATVAANVAAAEAAKPKKQINWMLIGLIAAVVVAVCGIGFGVMMMTQKNNEAASYEKQIATLKNTNAELTEQVAAAAEAANEMSDELALKILQEIAESPELGYTVEYAHVASEDGAGKYLIKYVTRDTEGWLTEQETYLVQDASGAWLFADVL